MQEIIILIALASAVGFSVMLVKSRPGRRGLLGFSVIALCTVATYEIYMHFIWEKSVHAPIRIDILFFELPLLFAGYIAGTRRDLDRAPRTSSSPLRHTGPYP